MKLRLLFLFLFCSCYSTKKAQKNGINKDTAAIVKYDTSGLANAIKATLIEFKKNN